MYLCMPAWACLVLGTVLGNVSTRHAREQMQGACMCMLSINIMMLNAYQASYKQHLVELLPPETSARCRNLPVACSMS